MWAAGSAWGSVPGSSCSVWAAGSAWGSVPGSSCSGATVPVSSAMAMASRIASCTCSIVTPSGPESSSSDAARIAASISAAEMPVPESGMSEIASSTTCSTSALDRPSSLPQPDTTRPTHATTPAQTATRLSTRRPMARQATVATDPKGSEPIPTPRALPLRMGANHIRGIPHVMQADSPVPRVVTFPGRSGGRWRPGGCHAGGGVRILRGRLSSRSPSAWNRAATGRRPWAGRGHGKRPGPCLRRR